jgi:LPPG:FO 2-phospho-L-lactate transferase
MKDLRITALAGGVGAARLLQGLVRVADPRKLTVIVNTGDDIDFFGLRVSPDIDIILYTLAGVVHPLQGWGLAEESFSCLRAMEKFGHASWFQLGDRDLATHLHRTHLLRQGWPLTRVTDSIRKRFAVLPRVLPMTDDRVATHMITAAGKMHFQEYLVKRKSRDRVRGVVFTGAEKARANREVLSSIRQADFIIVCPSNPIVSIGPILAVPGIREALRKTKAKIAAVSPIVAGRAIKGPAVKILSGLGMEASAAQVAELYRDFIDLFVIDEEDKGAQPTIASLGCRVMATDTIMKDLRSKTRLAREVLRALGTRA